MSERFMLQPGPTQVTYEVQSEGGRPVIHHSDPEFIRVYDETAELLKPVFGASDDSDVILIPASGRGGLESVATSFAEPTRPVMVLDTGIFSGMLLQILNSLQIPSVRVNAYPGERLSKDEIRKLLEMHQPCIVAVPQTETSTGTSFDTTWLAGEVHEHGALFMVDAVAALGGEPVNMQQNNIDIVVSGSQKSLGGLTGVTMIALAPRAIAKLRGVRPEMPRSFYFDLNRWYKNYAPLERGGELVQKVRMLPWSMNTSTVYALKKATEQALAENLSERFEKHRQIATSFRYALSSLGFTFLDEEDRLAPTLTVAKPPEGVLAKELLDVVSTEHEVAISGGLGSLWRGNVIRVGHMGQTASKAAAIRGLIAIEDALIMMGKLDPKGGSESIVRTFIDHYRSFNDE